jgi:hypothetical protein
MAAEDAARTFAAVVDAVAARPGTAQGPPPADPTDDGGGGSADG